MKVISPAVITDAMLISSTAPETDYAVWSAVTAYSVGNRVIRTSTHRIYERVVAGTTTTAPEVDLVNWIDVAPTNRWACFDSQVNTATTVASPLTVVLAPGYINSLAVLGMAGTSLAVTVTDGAGGATVYSATVTLDGTIIADWYQYVWEAFDPLTEVVFTDIPPYINARVTVSITGSTVACAVLVVGTVYTLGDTKLGARLGIIDYSRKDTDAFGTVTFVRRAFSKRLTTDLVLASGQLNKVSRVLEALRAMPCVWIGSEDATFQALIVYGFYRDFGLTISYPTYTLCNLEIEGLT
jgi:hypothetical protein